MSKQAARIVMVVENNPYPFDTRVRCEAETLAEAGYQVTVVCPAEEGEARRETINGVRVYRFPAPRQGRGIVGYFWEYTYGTAAMLAHVIWLLLRGGFDVLHSFNPPDTVWIAEAVAKLLGKRTVFDGRDPSPELYASKFGREGGFLYRTLVWMERQCCRQADLVIVPNDLCRQLEIERHGLPPEKTVIISNGPRLEQFRPVAPNPVLRAKAPVVIGYLGHMSSQDGIEHLLRSLHHLKYEIGRSDFFAVLTGPADDLAGLQRLTRELQIQDHVLLTGKIPFGEELLGYLSSADICVEPASASPLNNKSTMTKLSEYMALSKPIVAYDLPGNRLLADQAALYARADDEGEFARNIAVLMDSPELRQTMGARGRARVEAELSWEYSSRRLLAAYDKLLRGTSQGSATRQLRQAGD